LQPLSNTSASNSGALDIDVLPLDTQGYRWYNYRMIDTQTTKISRETLKQLRMLHALTGERMILIMARLVAAELARVQKEVTPTK